MGAEPVTDNNGWQPPASGFGSTPEQQPLAWQQPQAGWTPPPKPGLIPLHPLSFGTIMGSSFRVMRRNPGPTFGLSVLIYGVVTVVYAVVLAGLIIFSLSRVSMAALGDANDIIAGSVGLIALGSLIPTSLTLIGTALLQAIISLEVSRATLGEKLKTRGLWRLAKGRIGTMIGWGLVLTGAIFVYVVVAAVAMGISIAGIASTSPSNPAAGITAMLGLFGVMIVIGLVFAVLGAWLGIKTSLVPSVIMLERLSLFDSIKRSWELTNGHFWRTLGMQLLIGIILNTVSSVVTAPLSMIAGVISGLTNPMDDPTALIVLTAVIYLLTAILSVVVGAIGIVMQSASLALIYIDIRMRKEGLDLELMQYIEAKQTSTPGVENPYLRLQGGMPSAPPQTGSPWA